MRITSVNSKRIFLLHVIKILSYNIIILRSISSTDFFFLTKEHRKLKIFTVRAALWETASSVYSGLKNYQRPRYIHNPFSFSQAFSDLVSRMSKKLNDKNCYYEYKLGRIRIKTYAQWTREQESDVEAQARLERL